MASYPFTIEENLLFIGFLTTPPDIVGLSLAEYWAWVRYVNAVSDGNNFKLRANFGSIDAHQKTILSDDFGMGFTMCWLSRELSIDQFCDGLYFVNHVGPRVGVRVDRIAKNGAKKTPDFICRSTALSRYHVIECKGTQSSPSALKEQMKRGHQQTSNVSFSYGQLGERIVAGFFIGTEGGSDDSFIRIEDPDDDAILEIQNKDEDISRDAMNRAMAAKSLRLSGFPQTSNLILYPDGGNLLASKGGLLPFDDEKREAILKSWRSGSKSELGSGSRDTYTVRSQPYEGREAILPFSAAVVLGDKEYRGIRVRQGMPKEATGEILQNDVSENFLEETSTILCRKGSIKFESEQNGGRLFLPNGFVSELELLQ